MPDADILDLDVLPGVRRPVHTFWRDLWARTAAHGLVLVVAYFTAWEVIEPMLGARSCADMRVLHLVRGIGAALLLGTWSFVRIRKARLASDTTMAVYMNRLEQRVRERTHDLEEARAFTELLFDSLRERIIVLDRDGRVVKANRVAEAIAGQSLVGSKCIDRCPGCAQAGSCFGCRGFANGVGSSPRTETRADASGRLWELELITVPDKAGRAGYVIEVGRDVTEPKNLEAQVRHQENMASLGVLTAGFAHDLGNPLTSLSTELELLEGEEDVARIRESLGVLRGQVSRMSRTLREMVDFARRRRDEVTDVSLASAVADSARLVCHDPRWKRVELVLDIPPDVPHVHMVEDHLVLVLVNLMLNAADAMPSGGTLTVSARREAGGVALSVRDSGTGMTPEVLARARTPLYTTKGKSGTGLGLAVCESIVRAMGGALELESAPGKGTEVCIRLPRQEAPDA